MESKKTYTVFVANRLIASGALEEVLSKMKECFARDRGTPFLVFDDETGAQVDFDLRGTLEEILTRAREKPAAKGPGRPKLGVTAREVTLLPRHWDWLEQQENGASAALRRLIDEARKREPEKARKQQAVQATGRFISAMAGNLTGYEEASRVLYRGDRKSFREATSRWPKDIREHALYLSKDAF
ncbi:MAG TPA: DUF2239 family protein [Opitutaceae bacterium]|nr:DUF2239 family protein [Opitutaceae bacterium]